MAQRTDTELRKAPRKPRLTYANVMSTIALFVALGGASYAADSALGPGSVGTRQLRGGAVTPSKLGFAYQSGTAYSLFAGRRPEISLEERCPKNAVKCPPPTARLIAQTSLRLARRARLMISASNVVTNNARSYGANVFLVSSVQNATVSQDGCFAQTTIPRQSAGTVSCLGATGALPAGRYHLYLDEEAGGAKATAAQISIAWWTRPPSSRNR